ncbi:hypothetical protein BLNAU_24042 [Blattamonas nauphoetae]|uniref:Uncharacterized protein n=1 Tax=Blattamonas nauphoetae TaxID=2049346 RepID=A0ABQ9WNI0_9EUKA|nr:hypothetical protein BLNAU_24042 [Blattamonas nauphoetae]
MICWFSTLVFNIDRKILSDPSNPRESDKTAPIRPDFEWIAHFVSVMDVSKFENYSILSSLINGPQPLRVNSMCDARTTDEQPEINSTSEYDVSWSSSIRTWEMDNDAFLTANRRG